MRFNPLEWKEIPRGKEIEVPPGLLQLRSSSVHVVTAQAFGVEAFLSSGFNTSVTLTEAATLLIDAEGPVYMKERPKRAFEPTGPVFTNIDRLPHESGSMDAVLRAVRLLKIEDRARVRRIREAREVEERAAGFQTLREAKAAALVEETSKDEQLTE